MRFPTEICVLLLFALTSGCALFSGDTDDRLQDKIDADRARAAMKPPVVPMKRIVRLSSSVIAQPVSENRVRTAVWQQLCETCLKKPQARRHLNQAGFRVGVSQPPYPWALDSLLSTSMENQRRRRSGQDARRGPIFFSASGHVGTPVVIPDGSDSLIEVRRGRGSEIPADVTVPGLTNVKPNEVIRCVLRIKTLESGDGWSLMRFQPELQYGSESMRLTIRYGQDQLPVRQKIVPLFEQQFEVKLRSNDVIVLGHHPQEKWTTGRFFFRSDALNGSRDHLVVLKIAEIESVEGRPSLQVNYRKY